MTTLEDFAVSRVRVNEFLRVQRPSVGYFWDKTDKVFFRTAADRDIADMDTARVQDTKVHRLTSTVTCLESILEAPAWDKSHGEEWTNSKASEALTAFMEHALSTKAGWVSDGAAWVYCRVRTIGGALRLLPEDHTLSAKERRIAKALLEEAWRSRYDNGGSFGLRESTKEPARNPDLEEEASHRQYPANAFLTYWGLLALDLAASRKIIDLDDTSKPTSREAQTAARDWLRETLATQVTFHFMGSSYADPQQLAWALCGLVRFGDKRVLANAVSTDHELLVAGLKAFFDQQRDGTWSVGAPLFHYRNAGNAYAYIYETLGELLCLATSREIDQAVAETLRENLRDYSQELMHALLYAEQTAQSLTTAASGWSSGHHPHRNSPESWATASVFRFAQGLRRLVGSWSSDAAKEILGARNPKANLGDLFERGATWDLGHGTAGSFLSTAFVHPVQMTHAASQPGARFHIDPDERVLGNHQARSAMLFGPPGTSKTKMVEAVAGAIGWDFIEITPAQFLDEGVDHVSARADAIFRQAMELDHCVILLDEIDELIQKRTTEAETIERFFTTTMLPRLAKLWEARRILFFVNTNNIERVDSAIVRSQRFDAARMILPPGYDRKASYFSDAGFTFQADAAKITKAIMEPDALPSASSGIGWLALVRFDQYDAVVRDLRNGTDEASKATPVSDQALADALQVVAAELRRLDWYDGKEPELMSGGVPLPAVKKQFEYERRDARMVMWAQTQGATHDRLEALALAADGRGPIYENETTTWVCIGSPESPEQWAAENSVLISPHGIVSWPDDAEEDASSDTAAVTESETPASVAAPDPASEDVSPAQAEPL